MEATTRQRRSRKEALFYQKLADSEAVQCRLCPRECVIPPGESGFCKVRSNFDGCLYARNYAWIRAMNLEHIERVPLVEFYNGMGILLVGSYGCNMICPTCFNWQLVEGVGSGRTLYPGEIIEVAAKLLEKDNIGIAYTFNEPTVWYEFVLECAQAAKGYDMKNVLSTNGVINREPLLKLLPYIDAVNLDIKSMDWEYYDKVLHAPLATVLENAKLLREYGVHLEISNVVIPGLNDGVDEISRLASFVARELGKEVPLHLLAHLPNGKTRFPETTEEQLLAAADVADRYLDNVYIGTP